MHFHPKKDEADDILKVIMGPSGNLRAPSLVVGNKLVVGFHQEMYTALFD